MTRTRIKLLGAALMTGLLLIMPFREAFAAGTVTVAADKDTAAVGDTCMIAYKTEGAGDGAEAPEISVEYDENRLSVVESDKTYGGGGGKLTFTDTEATITFTILSGGPAEVYVTAILDGDGAEPATGSVTVNVEGEDTAAAASAAPAAATTSTGIEAGTVASLDGTRTISTVFPDEMMPELFTKQTAAYGGTTIEVAKFDMGNIILVYVTDDATNTGGFCVMDQSTGELTDFRQIRGIENKYIIILNAPSDAEVPLGFTKAKLMWNDQALEAYMIADSSKGEGSSDEAQPAYSSGNVSAQDFFLVYAISSEGNEGWYLYDQKEGTYQRYLQVIRTAVDGDGNQMPITEAAAEAAAEKYEKPMRLRLIIICALGAICLILLIIVIVLAVKSGRDDDEEDEDEDKDMNFIPADPRGNRRNAQQPRHRIAVAEDDDDEDDYDDDDEEEDDDDDDDDYDDDEDDDEDDYEDDDDEEEDDDDDEEDDVKEYVRPVPEKRGRVSTSNEDIDSSRVLNPRTGKEKRRKNEPIEHTQAIDWADLESVVKDASSDSRRPVGNNTSALPARYRIESELDERKAKKEAAGKADKRPERVQGAQDKRQKADKKPSSGGASAPVISSGKGTAISRDEAASIKKTASAASARTGNTGALAIAEAAAAAAAVNSKSASKATPVIPANMPKRAQAPAQRRNAEAPYYTDEQPAAPTMREEVQAEKRGRGPAGGKRNMYEPDDVTDDDEDEDEEDEGFSFFRRNKQKVPKKVEQKDKKGRRERNQEDGMNQEPLHDEGSGRGRRGQEGTGRQASRGQQSQNRQGYDGNQGYAQTGYDQSYQGYVQGAGYNQGQAGYMNQGYAQGAGYNQGQAGYMNQGYAQEAGYNQGQAGYMNQGYGQGGYDQGYGQGAGYNQGQAGYMNQGYGQGGYPQGYSQDGMMYQEYPQQPMYNTADFDEDFEFNFIDVN